MNQWRKHSYSEVQLEVHGHATTKQAVFMRDTRHFHEVIEVWHTGD